MLEKLAQADGVKLGPDNGFKGFGPLGTSPSSNAPRIFTDVISMIIGVMTVVAIIWFVIQLFLGAVSIIFSGGDKGKMAEARGKITTSLAGLVIVIFAISLIELVGSIIGINILDLTGMIETLSP